jgi:hypothetical protein
MARSTGPDAADSRSGLPVLAVPNKANLLDNGDNERLESHGTHDV